MTSQIELPLLPLKDIVVFPHMIVPIFVSEELCMNAIEAIVHLFHARANDPRNLPRFHQVLRILLSL